MSNRGGRGGGRRGGGRGSHVAESSISREISRVSLAETDLAVTRVAPPSSRKAERFPARPQFGSVGRKCVVRANHFLVELADKDLFHYDVTISPELLSRAKNRLIISDLVKTHQNSFLRGKIPAYDGNKSLYTAGEFPFKSKDFIIKLSETDPQGKPRGDKDYKVVIKLVGTADVHNLKEFLNGRQLDVPQDTIQALDVVLRQTPSNMHTIVGRSFFSLQFPFTGNLGDGVEYCKGFYQSLRPTQMGLSLNIDVAATSFYKGVPVLDFIKEFLNVRDISRPLSDTDRNKLRKVLRGIRVEATHTGNRYKITEITRVPIGSLMFDDQGNQKSVLQYFREKYNCNISHPKLPCLQAGNNNRIKYLPIEVCKILPGQRFGKKLNEKQVTAMLKATCIRPRDRENSITNIVRENNYNNDVYAKQFGLRVLSQMVSIDARILPPPKLKYHDSGKDKTCVPQVGQWNMIGKKMVNGGRVDFWTCVCFSGMMNQGNVMSFCNDLVSMCNTVGMVFNPKPCIAPIVEHPKNIESSLRKIHQLASKAVPNDKHLQLLIIILPDITGSYGKIKKICETELGIVSQCLQFKQLNKGGKQYQENVALKINVKVGGRNSVLEDVLYKRMPYITDVPTIIFGADVTHPSPGEDSSPSIAAVVASMDWPEVTKYKGLISAQTHREEMILDLFNTVEDPTKGSSPGGMIRELLRSFYRSTGRKPARIIFYRDGVSEGQFSHVLYHEMLKIRQACASIDHEYAPRVTFVVVQKRHHTRFFPEVHGNRDMTDRSGNILPGTVVDRKICHPTEFDFYLCSHAGIQGTSRPTHYHVLYDENNFTADALQILTNNLCYTYARCTRSVSIVPPVYYAHLAAFRARYYVDADQSDAASSAGDRSRERPVEIRQLPKVKENVKEVMFYC